MQLPDESIVEKATVEDAEEILALQKTAYVSEAELIDDFTIPPLHQTIDDIISEFNHQVILKFKLEKRIIGSVRCYLEKGTCYIGKLIVHPDYQNLGIGTKLLRAAECQFQHAERYELFTGEMSKRNLHIYEKNGYRVFYSKIISQKLTLLFLEKINKKA
ncbi:MAG: GNAT family N-acetyltransferase [Desulforhopalus sp.]|nr:GNAT family N-acetyltransferase [Desulforhopalus sp.]